jgi:hypothetical protein
VRPDSGIPTIVVSQLGIGNAQVELRQLLAKPVQAVIKILIKLFAIT